MRIRYRPEGDAAPPVYPTWTPWPVNWTAIWVGVLAALCVALVIGLIAIAVGAHELGPGGQIVTWHQFGWGALIFGVIGAFFSFVVGGWVATKIAGIHWAEPAMLHGAIVFLLAVPFLVAFAALGAGNFFGVWGGGVAGTPVWATATNVAADPNAAAIARNTALGAVTSLLLGVVGSVIGGWMASGEPMHFQNLRHHDHHDQVAA
jgi:hypothetical protein